MPSTPVATSDMLRLLKEGRGVGVSSRGWYSGVAGQVGGASMWTLHARDGGGLHRPKKKGFGEADAFSPLGMRE